MIQTINVRGLDVRCELAGSPGDPVLVLCHALGTDLGLWDSQVETFARSFRVLRYDVRGHGGTDVPTGPYTIDMIGGDLIALLDTLAITRAHVAGVSLGGFIAQWIGANAPERVNRLVLANTAAQIGSAVGWDARIAMVREQGIESVVEGSMSRWFTPAFVAREPAVADAARRTLGNTTVEGYTSCCAAIRDMDLRGLAPLIQANTIVIAGNVDQATPPADAAWLAHNIPRARCVTYSAAHLANVEARDDFNTDVMRFLSSSEE